MSARTFVSFANGVRCPILGYGTYLMKGELAYKSVKTALDIGYRHIDTAFGYQNEKEVGRAINEKIADGLIKREDVFLVSKLSSTNHRKSMVVPALRKTLENLNVSYLDMFLVHAPWSAKPLIDGEIDLKEELDAEGKAIFDEVDLIETWRGMEKCVTLGLTKCIGISNFNKAQTMEILKSCKIKPVTNQVECHHLLNQEKLQQYSKKEGVTITAYRSLGGPKNIHLVMGDKRMEKIAAKYSKTTSQIIIRWLIQRGILVLPKSSNPDRMKQNYDVFDFEISEEDMSYIQSLNTNTRHCKFLDIVKSKYYPFAENIEF